MKKNIGILKVPVMGSSQNFHLVILMTKEDRASLNRLKKIMNLLLPVIVADHYFPRGRSARADFLDAFALELPNHVAPLGPLVLTTTQVTAIVNDCTNYRYFF